MGLTKCIEKTLFLKIENTKMKIEKTKIMTKREQKSFGKGHATNCDNLEGVFNCLAIVVLMVVVLLPADVYA